jgi:ribosomal protein S18 acetylase RimI-like enzyme
MGNRVIFEEKHVSLKNGEDCILRSPSPSDAQELLAHLKQTSRETDYMLRYPEEVVKTVAEEEAFIANYLENPKSMLISAVIDGRIIANAGLSCVMDVYKYRHRAEFGISVKREYWHLGIGTLLLTEIIECAEKAGYEQLELEVSCENERAVSLYRRLGFEVFGTRERSFKFKDGTYSSDYLMLLPLGPARRF